MPSIDTLLKALANYTQNCKDYRFFKKILWKLLPIYKTVEKIVAVVKKVEMCLSFFLQRFSQQFYMWTTIFTAIFSEKSLQFWMQCVTAFRFIFSCDFEFKENIPEWQYFAVCNTWCHSGFTFQGTCVGEVSVSSMYKLQPQYLTWAVAWGLWVGHSSFYRLAVMSTYCETAKAFDLHPSLLSYMYMYILVCISLIEWVCFTD